MHISTAHELIQAIIFLFDRNFKQGYATITLTGSLRFDLPSVYAQYNLLYESLRQHNENLAKQTLDFIRLSYKELTV